MSLILESGEKISRHPLNNSQTKQMYSFPKSKRFSSKADKQTEFNYNLPDAKGKRTTSLGFGKRFDFVSDYVKNSSKSPFYNIESSFSKYSKVKKTVPQSSKASQYYKKKYDDNGEKKVETYVPGPGSYNIERPLGKDGIKISMSFKLNKSNSTRTIPVSDVPGPGAYRLSTDLKRDGKHIVSNYKNSINICFDKSKRFQKEKVNDNPGPGSYIDKPSINGSGTSVLSTMRSSSARSILSKLNTKLKTSETPGPGYYKIPSEFGIYISKNALNQSVTNYSVQGSPSKYFNASRTLNSSLHKDNSVYNNKNEKN